MTELLNDEELRHLTISVMRAESARDKQTRVGASDLADQCDRCLAMKFAGAPRVRPPQADRVWLGAYIGTGIHGENEKRIQAHSVDPDSPLLPRLIGSHPEMRVLICIIVGYGEVYGTIDWSLPLQLVDFKGSTREKSAILRDVLAYYQGEPAPFGRKHKHVAGPGRTMMPQKEYDEKFEAMAYKVAAYLAQLSLYGLARERAGRPVQRLTIMWINRDGNGFFDLPHGNRYNDPKAMHDIWPLTFDYSRDHALGVVARAQRLYDMVTRGVPFHEIPSSPHCWVCSNEEEHKLLTSKPETIRFGELEVTA